MYGAVMVAPPASDGTVLKLVMLARDLSSALRSTFHATPSVATASAELRRGRVSSARVHAGAAHPPTLNVYESLK